jgi:short-subunit dehydrogenase
MQLKANINKMSYTEKRERLEEIANEIRLIGGRAQKFVLGLAALYLAKAFMPELLRRNSGHIVTVTSFAAKIPFSGATSYIASRKALLGLHEALSYDLHVTGIRTSLAYFAKVDSPLWEHNPGSDERLPRVQKLIKVISTERAAQAIIDGVIHNRREMYAPFTLKVILCLTWLAPAITRFIMNTTGYKRVS